MKKKSSGSLIGMILTFVVIGGLAAMPNFRLADNVGREIVATRKTKTLPTVGSLARLKNILRDMKPGQAGMWNDESGVDFSLGAERPAGASRKDFGAPADRSAKMLSGAEPANDTADTNDYSRTNVQVQGVDEADIVKTDGDFIYTLGNGRLTIIKARPADKLKIASKIDFFSSSSNFSPSELYVDDDRLIVIGQSSISLPLEEQPAEPGGTEPGSPGGEPGGPGVSEPGSPGTGMDEPVSSEPSVVSPTMVAPESLDTRAVPDYVGGGAVAPEPAQIREVVKVLVYDVSDKADPKKVREVEVEGGYLSSRKVGPALYIVSNKYLDTYRILNDGGPGVEATPIYKDSAVSTDIASVPYSQINYFPGPSEPSYLMVAGIDIEQPQDKVSIQTFLGAGQNIYASTKNLYVAAARYENNPTGTRGGTDIYKFALAQGHVEYSGTGRVPGTILNQFSMDEHEGTFRIATTADEFSAVDEPAPKNNLYTLDADLKTIGRLENLASGERIFSVRFLGARAYMVTFKQVDPLFVIDLGDPSKPRVLGELKIPGYSDYLHPYDENHILGFGKDAVGAPGSQPDDGSPAFYQGMKIALFDVSDVTKPIEKFKTVIGARGTESELLQNHKALLFDKEKDLLAFPVTVAEKNAEQPQRQPLEGAQTFEDATQYGVPSFQGAYVYDIDLERGLTLKGKIFHPAPAQTPALGRPEMDGDIYYTNLGGMIRRILYAGENLYTVSDGMVKANDLKTLEETGALRLE